ncbi:MAG: TonB-dependent receptor [Ignavibacteriae bacterium]|nr:TonB-dependent receptor [Ignavibacteriota bacterium]
MKFLFKNFSRLRSITFITFLTTLCFISAQYISASAVGKISGKIVDSQTKDELIGVNIIITDVWQNDSPVPLTQSIGAATDVEGNYVLLNLNPGEYSVKISMVGYSTKIIQRVKVSINRTTVLNEELIPETVSVEEVVVQAKKEVIKKDLTSSVQTISANDLKVFNIESIGQAVSLTTGVVEGHFRGGRSGEVSYLVDGIQSGISLNKDAVQEIEVISGTFNAEYGKVMSGIVNTAPKEGGEKYSGMIRLYSSNYYTSHNYIGLSASDFFHDKEVSFSFGGPLLFKDLSFFILGDLASSNGLFYGIRRYTSTDHSFVGAGIPIREWIDIHNGDNAEVPMTQGESRSFMSNIAWQTFTNFKIGLLYQFENGEGQNGYNHGYKYIPDKQGWNWSTKHAATLSFTNTLENNAFHVLKLLYFNTDNQSSSFKDPYDSRFVNDLYNTNNGGFSSGGNDKGFAFTNDERIEAKYDLVWQVNKNHELKVGADYVNIKLDRYQFVLQNWYSIFDPSKEIDNYKPYIPNDTTTYANSFVKKPREFSAYIQDKAEFNDLVINFGLRYDYFDPETIYPTDLRNPANKINTVRKSEYLNADPQYQISPRIGLSYMMGDAAALHFSYGHFFQIPNYDHIFTNPNYEIASTNYASTIGNPNIEAEKTVKYELGLQLKLVNNLLFKTTLFYNDIYNLETVVPIETYDAIMYGYYTNLDYASARGLTAEFDYRTAELSIDVNYTLQFAEGNASEPFSNFTKAAQSVDPISTFIPLDWDQRHTLNLTVGYNVDNWGISLISSYGSGTKYTYSPPIESSLSLANIPENGWTKPSKYYADLKGYYDFDYLKAVKIDLRLGIYIYNIFDIRNEIQVYDDSGTANSTTDIERNKENYVSTFTNIYDYYSRPDYYSAPRSIKFELSLLF